MARRSGVRIAMFAVLFLGPVVTNAQAIPINKVPPKITGAQPVKDPKQEAKRLEMADLSVTRCAFTPASSPMHNQQISFEMNYKNIGNANAVINSSVTEWEVTGPTGAGGSGGVNMQGAYDIPPGVERLGGVRWPTLSTLSPGTYSFTAKVDPKNVVQDSNRSNNEMTCSLTITPAQLDGDLIITSMTLSPTSPSTSAAFNLLVTVRNQGTAPVQVPANTQMLSGAPYAGSVYEGPSATTIAAGASKTYTLGPTSEGAQRGTRVWTIKLDPGSRLVESLKTNNQSTISVTVR